MYTFLRKISLFSTCISSLESAFIPGLKKLKYVMAYRRRPNLGIENEISTFDYNHRPYNEAMEWQAPSIYDKVKKLKPVNVNCGELRTRDAQMVVHMTGRMKFQRVRKFLSLKDSHGETQLVIPEERPDLMAEIGKVPADSHIEIIGIVQERPATTFNRTTPTGKIEVYIDKLLDFFAPKRKLDEISGEGTSQQNEKKSKTGIPMTPWELSRCVKNADREMFCRRTHRTSDLMQSFDAESISISGWLVQKRCANFGILSDGFGRVQIVLKNCDIRLNTIFNNIAINDKPIYVVGNVRNRPPAQRNVNEMENGSIEFRVQSIEVIDEDSKKEKHQENNDVLQSELPSESESQGGVNSYCDRTHTCDELRGSDVGKEVVLCGWLESQRTHRFAKIRDGHGSTQLLIDSKIRNLTEVLQKTPLESVIKVTGTVQSRPNHQINEEEGAGEIEVCVNKFEVLNPAKSDLPFAIRDHNRPKENYRMKYRYLDLRFRDMQYKLRLRSEILMRMREFLINKRGFVEVETPTLFRRTPGGAQEYVVPTRTKGKFYSLVQSPQQLKQLLMIGSMDRYFQVARCYRDEGARPDRQPEFTQMDIELSFTDEKQIMSLVEDLLKASFRDKFPIQTPFPVITYKEAMNWYGSDKPDMTFEKKLIDISDVIENKDLLPENVRDVRKFTAKALIFENSKEVEKKLIKVILDCEDQQKLKGDHKCKIISVRCQDEWQRRIEESLPFVKAEKLKDVLEFPVPSIIVVGVGQENEILPLMGKIRNEMFKKPTMALHFAWIVDFPLFLEQDDGTLESAHHPFTMPHKEDADLLTSNPLEMRGLHFDLVLNGYEVGGGSVRIHDPNLQTRVLADILKLPTDSLSHLLDALASGAPPHGGIALGIDRLFSVLLGADSIREVIAFPKGVDGKDPLSGAPCSITEEEKKLYHLLPRSPK